jgi:hypothetical protein
MRGLGRVDIAWSLGWSRAFKLRGDFRGQVASQVRGNRILENNQSDEMAFVFWENVGSCLGLGHPL